MKQYSRYAAWGTTAVVVACVIMLFYDALFGSSSIGSFLALLFNSLAPVLYGIAMAYLLAPVVDWFEKKIFRTDKGSDLIKYRQGGKWVRVLSILLTWVVVLVVLYAFLRVLLPELYKSLVQLVDNVDGYYRTVVAWVTALLEDNPTFAQKVGELIGEYYQDAITWLSDKLMPQVQVAVQAVTGGVMGVVLFVYNLLIGIIVSVYILSTKESFGATGAKLCYTFLPGEYAALVIRGVKEADRIFSGFVRGKLLDSLIIGIMCFFFSTWFNFPYAPLVSLVVGVTNVIPFFGPFLGAIPSAFLILLDSPIQCLYFVLFILALQQFDGNILGPWILGDSTGLSSFWVIVAILAGGGLFGVAGMFFGVPVFACFYTAVRTYSSYRLKKKGLPTETVDYATHAPRWTGSDQPVVPASEEKSE